MKMISNDLRSSCRSLLLGAYQEGGGGSDNDDWTYPSDWLTLPDPAENEVYLLIANNQSISPDSTHYINVYPSSASIGVDWGDGTISDTHTQSMHSYTFGAGSPIAENSEQYIVRITTDGSNYIGYIGSGCISILAAKIHTSVLNGRASSSYKNNTFINDCYGFQYAKLFGAPDNLNTADRMFLGMFGLRKIEFEQDMETIPENFIYSCYRLKKISFPKAKKACSGALSALYGLKEIELPQLEEAEGNFLAWCYSLEKADLPKLAKCNTQSAFSSCYSLKSINAPSLAQVEGSGTMGNYCGALSTLTTSFDWSDRSIFFPESYLI